MTKKILSLAAIAAICALSMTSCDDNDDDDDAITTVTFEEFGLSGDTAVVGVSATEKNITFDNYYDASQYYNSGFTVSTMTDMETAGYMNQYSVYATSGAGNSTAFAIYNPCYYDSCFIKAKTAFQPQSVDVCLTTYTYLSAKNGDDYAKKLGDDDWFFATFTGYDIAGKETGSVEVKLIDGDKWIDTWTTISLSDLGEGVNKIFISFDGSDKGDWGLNTPAYIALDNLKVKF